jgi:excisionase family DNA binding protein
MISSDIMGGMPAERTPLYVRLPRSQMAALDRLAQATGRPKQHLVTELLADRLPTVDRQELSVGRVEAIDARDRPVDEVLTLEEIAAFLKLSPDAVRSRAEQGDLPGRRFGKEWRFAVTAVLAWLADGDTPARKAGGPTGRRGRRTTT